MKGSEAKMTGVMEDADKCFEIPVYQKKYYWKFIGFVRFIKGAISSI